MRWWLAILTSCLLIALSGCQPSKPAQPIELSGPTMGTQWLISIGTQHANLPPLDDLQHAIETELARINQLMSTWDASSELSQFNAALSTDFVELHSHTRHVLNTALTVSAATAGAYDVTRGIVFALWGFSADEPQPDAPSQRALNAGLQSSGWQNLSIQGTRVSKQYPALTIDLSSVAKGFAVDQLGELLQTNGIDHYVVNIGGEIESRGERSKNKPWRIGIESPDQNRSVETGLVVNKVNLATSGSYRNVRIVNAKRVSHLIDGRTGLPIDHRLVAATVVHESTMLADAWSTAFMVTGAEWAKAYAIANELAVQLTELSEPLVESKGEFPTDSLDGAFEVWQSPKWQELQPISTD